jgi:3-oxoacyl-ACP reductase-like protein
VSGDVEQQKNQAIERMERAEYHASLLRSDVDRLRTMLQQLLDAIDDEYGNSLPEKIAPAYNAAEEALLDEKGRW